MTAAKLLTLEGLAALRIERPDARIVLCHGTFDLVHVGHVQHFDEAAALGDVLVVTLTGDQHVTKQRAVAVTEAHRAHQVAALAVVDFVAIVQEPSAVAAIVALRPDVYVKGAEYADLTLDLTANIHRETALVESYGGRVHFTTGETFSSTKLAHFLRAAPEAAQADPLLRNAAPAFVDLSDRRFALADVKSLLVRARGLRVCLLGETIIDEWVDVAVTQLSQKSRCVAGQEVARMRQVGGVGIIARHLADFVLSVDVYTNGVGVDRPPNVRVTSLCASPLIKTRFVDRASGLPLFESKILDLDAVSLDLPAFDDYDLVLVADFGHGLLDVGRINAHIAAHARSAVAVMAQVNSSNHGYNLPVQYAGADYYSANRVEAELSLQARELAASQLTGRLQARLGGAAVSVTDGAQGAVVRARLLGCYALPALSTAVVDTLGCGDAYFALSSLAVALGLPAHLVALAGSIGAAAMTQRRANARPVSAQEFLTIAKIVI